MKLSKVQLKVLEKVREGSVIGELSNKINGRYELFIRKPNWFPKTCHLLEHPFIIRRLNKNTVFALLDLGIIKKDNSIKDKMLPFSRDCWYVYNMENL